MGCRFVGCGEALPALEVENDALAAIVETSNEWIVTRTGIESRHVATSESQADLAERAARAALGWEAHGWSERPFRPEEIDLLVCATVTSDTVVPSAASELRRRLGLPSAIAFDLNAACSGFLCGSVVAESMMAASALGSGARDFVRRALVVGSEVLSRITNWADRTTCVLFGDGAGAAVLEWDDNRPGILGSHLVNADDDGEALHCVFAYNTAVPFTEDGIAPELLGEGVADNVPLQAITMNGKEVFKFAANAMAHAVSEVLARCGKTLDDVSLIIPHQANERIVRYAAKKLGCPLERFHLNIAHVGNTSAASVPIALADAYEKDLVVPGDLVMLVGFGGGYTSGALLYEA